MNLLKTLIKLFQKTCNDPKHKAAWEEIIGCQLFCLQRFEKEYTGPVAGFCPFCGKVLKKEDENGTD